MSSLEASEEGPGSCRYESSDFVACDPPLLCGKFLNPRP